MSSCAAMPRDRSDSMTPTDGLSASARDLLTSWTAPDISQELLRDAYLTHIATYDNALLRECRAGHLTASTIIVDTARSGVLLTLHPIVGRWLQTGGHCEPDDADIVAAAEREAREESGIADLRIDALPLRLDRHEVLCRPDAGPATLLHHLDVQFLAIAPSGAQERRSEESTDLRWWSWSDLPVGTDESVHRLVAAARGRLAK